MNEDHTAEPAFLTQVGWFFWRNWNRVVCATRGHDVKPNTICGRCGLPIATFEEIEALREELEDERADRLAFHRLWVETDADLDALKGEHRG